MYSIRSLQCSRRLNIRTRTNWFASAYATKLGMLLRDCAGLPVTCASHEALEVLDGMLAAAVSFREFPLTLARRAIELDPGLVLAHCMLVSAHDT